MPLSQAIREQGNTNWNRIALFHFNSRFNKGLLLGNQNFVDFFMTGDASHCQMQITQ